MELWIRQGKIFVNVIGKSPKVGIGTSINNIIPDRNQIFSDRTVIAYDIRPFHFLWNNSAALQPPNPDAIFRQLFISFLVKLSTMRTGFVTPIS